MLSCIPVAFAVEDKNVVIDTSVPVFKDLQDGGTYKGPKDIYIADLSKVNYVILKEGTGSVSFEGRNFSGYTEQKRGTDLECINYVKVHTISADGSYMVYAIDEYEHGTIVEFVISGSTPTPPSGGGGGGGGGGGVTTTVEQPYANGDSKNTKGNLVEGEKIKLETKTDKAKIYYTTDGTKPTSKSTLYDEKKDLVLEAGQTLKAVAIKNGKSSDISEWTCIAKEVEDKDDESGKGSGSIVKDVLETENHIVYMTGYPDKRFGPDNNMTRAEVATMFARLMKDKMKDDTKYPSTFSDVAEDAWYADYIGYMQKFEVIKGYEDGTFGPEKTITRAEFVTIASRFAEMTEEFECEFTDVNKDYWAYNYIAFAAHNAWIGGYEDNTFRAEKTITRAEVVTIVNNMLVREADASYISKNKADLVMFSDVTEKHWAYLDIIEATNEHDYHVKDNKEIWK